VRAQDQRAWERLVALYAPLVYRWCRQCGLQAADAADVGQEVFRAVARKIADFRRDDPRDSFRAWFRAIARSRIIDHLRGTQNRAQGVGGSDALTVLQQLPDDGSAETDPEADAREKHLLYGRAIDLVRGDFEEHTWQAFWGVVVEGRTPAAVAAELGMTRDAVYHAKARVLNRLRSEFADLIDLQAPPGDPPRGG
jgi:RNA polymerase sigma-70 factor (ECF subfamily)